MPETSFRGRSTRTARRVRKSMGLSSSLANIVTNLEEKRKRDETNSDAQQNDTHGAEAQRGFSRAASTVLNTASSPLEWLVGGPGSMIYLTAKESRDDLVFISKNMQRTQHITGPVFFSKPRLGRR